MTNSKQRKKQKRTEKARLVAIIIIAVLVIITGAFFSLQAFNNKDVWGIILGAIIVIIILAFVIIIYKRGPKDLKQGLPLRDERSNKVMQKAMSMAFLVSLYVLLAIGFLSDDLIPFRDVSQATSIAVGCMALLFAIFWAYYNKKEI